MTLSRADTARRNAHAVGYRFNMVNSWSGVVLCSRYLWRTLEGEPGRCPECLWLVADWGHNPDCPRRSKNGV